MQLGKGVHSQGGFAVSCALHFETVYASALNFIDAVLDTAVFIMLYGFALIFSHTSFIFYI